MTSNVKKSILVIIPCRNESGRIGSVIKSVHESIPAAEVLIINDASTDTSAREAKKAGVIVVSHACQLGYGAALETGYLYAVRNNYDIVIQMDGDGQHRSDQLLKILQPVMDAESDIAIGSRNIDPSTLNHISFIKKIGQKFFSAIIFLLCRMKLSDPTSGFQALNSRVLKLFSSGIFPCDYPDSDVILLAKYSGLTIKEVPVVMNERSGGTSMHSGLKPIYYGIKMLLSMFIVVLNIPTWHKWKQEMHNEAE